MAGTISLSMTQQFDQFGEPLSGGKLYGIQAATVSTPQNFFQDINLALPWPNPITLDAAGRIPQLFIADGLIKIRLTDAAGVVQLVADNVQVIGSSSGGPGSGPTFDPLSVFLTGDVKVRYGVGVHPGAVPGWVRCNGAAIGAAGSSGAPIVELAHGNCQPLFEYLWQFSDPVIYGSAALTVYPSRGTSGANNDWTSNKQIALPDMRARLLMGLADMGSTNNNVLAAVPFSKGNDHTLGSLFGNTSHTQTLAEMMGHRHAVFLQDPGHAHTGSASGSGLNALVPGAVGTFGGSISLSNAITVNSNTTGMTIHDGGTPANFNTTGATGSGTPTPFDITNPAMLITVYMKL